MTLTDVETTDDAETTYRIRLDGKRRPTLPAALLRAAGIDPSHELVARADVHGRVILEDPLVMLAAFQAAVADKKRSGGFTDSLVESLLADRASDASTRS